MGMQKSHNKEEVSSQIKSNGLWIPFTLIGICFVLSSIFVFKTLKSYKTAKPLLIKPSSVEEEADINKAIYKSLYPLKTMGFGVSLTAPKEDADDFEFILLPMLKNTFGEQEKNFKISVQKIDLSKKAVIDEMDCENTALFNMKRKIKKWDKHIYFSVCTKALNDFILFYDLK